MKKYGFKNISTGYVTVALTPDNPQFSDDLSHKMIEANRLTVLDSIEMVLNTMPKYFTFKEVDKMKKLTNIKYDKRIAQYNKGDAQWDTNVSTIMVIRGTK